MRSLCCMLDYVLYMLLLCDVMFGLLAYVDSPFVDGACMVGVLCWCCACVYVVCLIMCSTYVDIVFMCCICCVLVVFIFIYGLL